MTILKVIFLEKTNTLRVPVNEKCGFSDSRLKLHWFSYYLSAFSWKAADYVNLLEIDVEKDVRNKIDFVFLVIDFFTFVTRWRYLQTKNTWRLVL